MSDDAPVVPIFYFTKVKNVGDQVNVNLISWLFGRKAILSRQDDYHLLAIGSLMGFANQHSRVWGTGVLHPSVPVPQIPTRQIYSVRGRLSYEVLRQNGIVLRDIPLGDPAFLVSKVFPRGTKTKRYRLGIAAHYVDRSTPWVERMLANPEVADLDVRTDPADFLQKMDACEAVASSSLHGLIFAEALAIPNIWIKLSDKVLGDGFKFRDWFSLADAPQTNPAASNDADTAEDLVRRCMLHEMQIDTARLLESFPF